MQPGTPTKGASFAGDPTMNYPYCLTPGTSTEIILSHPSTSANTTDSCARDTVTSCDPPRQSLSSPTPVAGADLHNVLPPHTQYQTDTGIILCLPAQQNTSSFTAKIDAASVFRAGTGVIEGEKTNKSARDTMTSFYPPRQSLSPRTPAAASDLHEINLLPPHTRNPTQTSIILCLPAQQTRAKTRKSQPIPKNPPTQNLGRPKQLTRDETHRMLMDRARTEITRYLDQ